MSPLDGVNGARRNLFARIGFSVGRPGPAREGAVPSLSTHSSPLLACAASSRILAAAPGRCGSQPKISKTTPCKVAGGRRQGRFGPILDTSGKSTAFLHHRTIRETPAGLVERLAKPRLEHGDLGFGRRHVFRPVIRHSRCHRSALRPSMARTSGRGQIVIDIVEFAMLPVGPGKCTLRRGIIGVP